MWPILKTSLARNKHDHRVLTLLNWSTICSPRDHPSSFQITATQLRSKTTNHHIMSNQEQQQDTKQLLHWVHKIGDYQKSRQFFENELGMIQQRHEEFGEGCEAACNGRYNNAWSKTMIGYGPEDKHFVLELTDNKPIFSYEHGNDFRYVAINKNHAKIPQQVKDQRQHQDHVQDPDGNHYLLVDLNEQPEAIRNSNPHDPVQYVSIHSEDIETQREFYCNVCDMQVFYHEPNKRCVLGYSEDQAKLEIVQLQSGEKLNHAEAYGRLAISTRQLDQMYHKIKQATQQYEQVEIIKEPVSLATPGKADVRVVILQDPQQYEICFADEKDFFALALGDHSN